jgi:V8-like Glu-specific endopeptidase
MLIALSASLWGCDAVFTAEPSIVDMGQTCAKTQGLVATKNQAIWNVGQNHASQVDDKELFPAVMITKMGCTGTLINSATVLTAAHCFCQNNDSSLCDKRTLVYNHWSYYRDLSQRSGKVLIHPSYNYQFDKQQKVWVGTADIALIKLDPPLESNVWPLPQPLPTASQAPERCVICTMVGFGIPDSVDGGSGIQVRRYDDNTVVGLDPREEHVLVSAAVTTEKGDSGGPLLCGGKVVGVTTAGGPNGTSEYTNLAKYWSWIQANQ